MAISARIVGQLKTLINNMTNILIHGYLAEDVVEFCEKAIRKIKEIRHKSDRPLVPAELFEASEYLHSFRAYITSPLLEADARYRDQMENFRSEGMSVSAAESKARTTPEYRAYKYLERVDTLADEQILLVKKFGTRMDDEFQNAGGPFRSR